MPANLWRPAGVNNLWSNALNWSLLAVPTSSDGNVATFDGNVLSGPCSITGATRACNGIDFTGYTNTITFTSGLACSGDITLGAAMIFAGTGTFSIPANGTITSNGKAFDVPFSITGGNAYTFADAAVFNSTFTIGSSPFVLTGTTLTLNGSYVGNSSTTSGTASFIAAGSGSLTQSGGTIGNSFTINTAGAYTINNWRVSNVFTIITPNAVTVAASTTLTIGNGATIDTSTVQWVNIAISGSVTLSSTLNCPGNLSFSAPVITGAGYLTSCNNLTASGNGTCTLANDLNIFGNFNVNANAAFSGSINLYLWGNLIIDATHTLSGSSATLITQDNLPVWTSLGGGVTMNVTIPYGSTLTMSGTVRYGTGTFTRVGTMVILSSAVLLLTASCTMIGFNKIAFETVTITAGITVTMDKFFSGKAKKCVLLSSTSATNYTIAFQEGTEKMAKFVKISNCTISNRGQLLILTQRCNGRGNVGVRYINSTPNGVPRHSPSTDEPLAYGIMPDMMEPDPLTIM